MSKKLIKINADSSALEVAKMMSEYKVSSVILTSKEKQPNSISAAIRQDITSTCLMPMEW